MANYTSFHVLTEDENGVRLAAAGATVKIVNAAAPGTVLATVTADANGMVAAGSVTGAAGIRLLFRVENLNGLAGSAAQIAT